MDIDDMKLWR